jgi:DNA processing protein
VTGSHVLESDNLDYPTALRNLPQPPPILYVQGRLELLERPGIAVVGTRRHSTYGRDATVSLVVGLVRAGYVIISGLARGIDSIAHRTALDVDGETVAVLGTGLDIRYPPEHEEMARAIAERGCIVTEFPPGRSTTPALTWRLLGPLYVRAAAWLSAHLREGATCARLSRLESTPPD